MNLRSRALTVASLVVIALLIALVAPRLRTPGPEPLMNPASGFRVPPLAEIKRMHVTDYVDSTTGQLRDFEVPSEFWGKVRDCLSPSQPEPVTLATSSIGDLHMHLIGGEELNIRLYELGANLWFIVASKSSTTSFRGEGFEQIEQLLADARK